MSEVVNSCQNMSNSLPAVQGFGRLGVVNSRTD